MSEEQPLNIYLWLEDFDNSQLSEYERLEHLRDAVIEYNEKYNTQYMLDSTVRRYIRLQLINR